MADRDRGQSGRVSVEKGREIDVVGYGYVEVESLEAGKVGLAEEGYGRDDELRHVGGEEDAVDGGVAANGAKDEVLGGDVEGDKIRDAGFEDAEEKSAIGGAVKIIGFALFIKEEVARMAQNDISTARVAIFVIVVENDSRSVPEIFDSKRLNM